MKRETLITKTSGAVVPFSEDKLRTSLQRSGASKDIIDSILLEVKPKLFQGITTKKIYRMAFNLLKQRSKHVAAKYKLKNAIMELGPSGYSFESFVAEILKHQGYNTKVSQIVAGECVNHEIDVVAEKDNTFCMIECKYHNQPGTMSDVKIPLYIQARFQDVEKTWKQLPGHQKMIHQGWVVTNTKFTGDAVKYGTCAGLRLLSWDHPKGKGLKDLIDSSGLYPITCLTTLTKVEKQRLLDAKVVMSTDINNDQRILEKIGIKGNRLLSVMNEVQNLSKGEGKGVKKI
ncbi:MAG: restriction endonuclease [Bacteroidia bacterium]|nr:restriction endonuclease [Sphingobacteriaceae bacterium]MBP9070063.1 restriction endonuclease [Bacteroidia bacterium]